MIKKFKFFESRYLSNRESSKDSFVERSKNINNNFYSYDKVNYLNARTNVTITCPIHGDFEQMPYNHLMGKGCNKCGIEKNRIKFTKTKDKFIDDAKLIHGNRFNYDSVVYKNDSTKIVISCPIHGKFEQLPNKHLYGNSCPKCKQSFGEKRIENYLIKNNIEYEYEKKFIDCRNINLLKFDFYLPKLNSIIEFDGIQHYEPLEFFGGNNMLEYIKKCDLIKDEYCRKNNIHLLRIKHDNIDNIDNIISDYLNVIFI